MAGFVERNGIVVPYEPPETKSNSEDIEPDDFWTDDKLRGLLKDCYLAFGSVNGILPPSREAAEELRQSCYSAYESLGGEGFEEFT